MSQEPSIQAREKLLRDTFTPAETYLFGIVLLSAAGAFILGDARSPWLLGGLIIAGCLSPWILRLHEREHPFFIHRLWLKFWLLTAPFWLLLLCFVAGLWQNPLTRIDLDGETFWTLESINPWLPVAVPSTQAWFTLPGLGAAYLIAVNLFIIPKSRTFFERLFPWLCLMACSIAIFGYLQRAFGADQIWFTRSTGQSDFFAVFPYDGHWAAFALIWSSACVGMALLSTRYDDSGQFVNSIGPWYLTGAILLGSSGFIVQARWPAALLLIVFAGLLLLFSIHFLTQSKDPHRKRIALGTGLLSLIYFVGGIYRILQGDAADASSAALRRAAFDLFRESPLFGWGTESFHRIAPFYTHDSLMGNYYQRAHSDLLQMLAENGIIGTIGVLAVLVALILRFLSERHDMRLSKHFLIACGGLLLLALVDTPFMSPSVFFSFFILFFSALRWADLSRKPADEVDALPTLITEPTLRRVPFYTGPHKDKER